MFISISNRAPVSTHKVILVDRDRGRISRLLGRRLSTGCKAVLSLSVFLTSSTWPPAPCPAQTTVSYETVLHSFSATAVPHDGSLPYAGLVEGTDGNFYGTTYNGGTTNEGTVFQMTPTGTVTILHSFDGLNSSFDGQLPEGGVVEGKDGAFYGTTYSGGTSNLGTVFRVTASGSLTILHSFAGYSDGINPEAGLVVGANGNLYGTTASGGSNHLGTVFEITPTGTLTILHPFAAGTDGATPTAPLILGTDGNFYGTTSSGGGSGSPGFQTDYGTVFKMTPAGTVSILHAFKGSDGNQPIGGLVEGSDGNFYGTTEYGGSTISDDAVGEGYGTVFQVTPTGTETVLHSFGDGSITDDGYLPMAGLAQAANGLLYGTTKGGGAAPDYEGGAPNGDGTLFSVSTSGTVKIIKIYSSGASAAAGLYPISALISGPDGNFYGTTEEGGTADKGTAFRLTPTGSTTILHSFGQVADPADDGANCVSPLIEGSDGNFYGTTENGGSTVPLNGSGMGTVYEMTPAGTVTILHSFGDGSVTNDGWYPIGGLVEGPDGDLYGTTSYGGDLNLPGAAGEGTIFKITKSGTVTILHQFADGTVPNDGTEPYGGLCLATDGNFYGTTVGGGAYGGGVVFKVTPSGTESVLCSLPGNSSMFAGVIQGSDGNFYGASGGAGAGNFGAVFKVTPAGVYSVLYSFGSIPNDGQQPECALVEGVDGSFYGTTYYGGAENEGTVFVTTPAGQTTILHSFGDGTVPYDGQYPTAGLLLDSDGNFYGVTKFGGESTLGLDAVTVGGALFKMAPNGEVTILYSFENAGLIGNSDAMTPMATPIHGTDGNLYGTTECGGSTQFNGYRSGMGTIYRILGPPPAPTGLGATAGNAKVVLSWQGSPDASSYSVYRGTSAGGESSSAIASAITDTTYTDTGLSDGTTYYYVVQAANLGGVSALSGEASATPQAPPAAPTPFTATAGNSTVKLAWSKSKGATSYSLYRGTSAGGESAIPYASALTATGYVDTSVTNGTTYYYRVAAADSFGTGPQSAEVKARPVAPPTAPTELKAAPGDARIVLNWTAPANATTYDVYRGNASGGESTTPIAAGVSTTTYTNTGLTNGVTYYYTVSGVDAGGTGAHSNESSATPIAPPAAPAGLAASPGDARVVLSWSKSATAADYAVFRGKSKGGESGTPISSRIATTTYTDTTVVNGTQYYYTVAGINAGGTSVHSNEVGAAPVAPPPAPSGFTATAFTGKVVMSWLETKGAASYDVYRSNLSGKEALYKAGTTSTAYTDTAVTNGDTYYYQVAAVNAGGVSPRSAQVGVNVVAAAATFVKTDTTTEGNWKGHYGLDGYNVIGDTSANNPSYPGYALAAPASDQSILWSASSTAAYALQAAAHGSTTRVAGAWYAPGSFTINVDCRDTNTHQLALYFLDWAEKGRAETITLSDASTHAVLSTKAVSAFADGVYDVWDVKGNVTVTVTRSAGPNAVVSGLFFR